MLLSCCFLIKSTNQYHTKEKLSGSDSLYFLFLWAYVCMCVLRTAVMLLTLVRRICESLVLLLPLMFEGNWEKQQDKWNCNVQEGRWGIMWKGAVIIGVDHTVFVQFWIVILFYYIIYLQHYQKKSTLCVSMVIDSVILFYLFTVFVLLC